MSQAFISWLTATHQDLFGPYGKFATLFFEELVIQVPRADLVRQVLASATDRRELSDDTARQLATVWHPIHEVLPDYKFLEKPWQHEDARLLELAETVATQEALAEYPGIEGRALQHETTWAGAGLIDAVGTWAVLRARHPCAMLANQAEATVVDGVFNLSVPPTEHVLFSQVMKSRLPNPGHLSWERVIELRSSRFMDAFRRKFGELDRLIRDRGDERDVQAILDELERKDFRELALAVKPSARTAWAKALASNAPLPIPINPISLALSAADLKRTYDRQQRFGWLYFLLELDGGA